MINGHFALIPAVYLVFQKKDKVLLLRRYKTGYMDGYYSLPAGHVDGNEPALKAAIREAKEEVGLTLKPAALKLAHTMHRKAAEGDHERMDLFFTVSNWGDSEPVNAEPHKCDELRWVPINQLPNNMVPEVRQALEQIAAGANYSDHNF